MSRAQQIAGALAFVHLLPVLARKPSWLVPLLFLDVAAVLYYLLARRAPLVRVTVTAIESR